MDVTIQNISFEETLPFWQMLWPGAPNIEPVNKTRFLGEYDGTLVLGDPQFHGAIYEGKIVAVNSIVRYSDNMVRLRGLYVEPLFRGFGIGRKLIDKASAYGKSLGCSIMWGYPRKSSWRFYSSCDFIPLSHWFSHFGYGPNIWAIKILYPDGFNEKFGIPGKTTL